MINKEDALNREGSRSVAGFEPHSTKDNHSSVTAAPAAASAKPAEDAQNTEDDLTIAQAMHAFETLTTLYGFSVEAVSEAIEKVNIISSTVSGVDLVAACCDYILDNGLGIDSGGAIAPIDDCPHVINDTSADTVDREGEDSGVEKGTCSNQVSCACISVTAEDVPEGIFEMTCGYFDETRKQTKRIANGGFKDDIEYSASGDERSTCPKGENWWCLKCGGIYCSRYVNGHGVKHYEQNKEGHFVMIGLADLSVWCHNCGSYLQTHHNPRLSSILARLQEIKFRDER